MRKVYVAIFIVLGIISLMTACGRNGESQSLGQPINVNIDIDATSPLSDFFESTEMIALETNDSCLLSGVGHFAFSNDSIILQNGSDIYIFSWQGRFINSFNQKGQGPEEYIEINSLRVIDSRIYVLDRAAKKIQVYTSMGDFVKSITLDYDYVDFWPLDENNIVLASGNFNKSYFEFRILDEKSNNIIANICPYGIGQTVLMWDYIPFAGQKDEQLFVNVPFVHSTFILSDRVFDPIASYQFNTAVQLPEISLEEMDISSLIQSTANTNVVRQLGYYWPTDKCTYLSFSLFGRFGNSTHLVKFNNDEHQLSGVTLGVEFDHQFPYFNNLRGFHNGYAICISQAETLLNIDQTIGSTYWQDHNLTAEDNPVFILGRLKQF